MVQIKELFILKLNLKEMKMIYFIKSHYNMLQTYTEHSTSILINHRNV